MRILTWLIRRSTRNSCFIVYRKPEKNEKHVFSSNTFRSIRYQEKDEIFF